MKRLTIARQIAEALEVAHHKRIVHRDLKPANITITPDGVVKVLDFGLAKSVGGDGSSPELTNAPGATSGGRAEGAVIGTAAYMSPEQARGLPVDNRTDIWAFGCVLYEMLTGRVAFAGDTVSDSIAKILEREPDWSALPAATPVPIRRLLLRCLAKDPKQRLRDFGDIRIEIDATDDVLPGVPALGPGVRRRTTWLPWVALAVLAVAVGAWEARRAFTTEENPLANATFSRVTNWEGTEEHAEISPDGRFVAFVADKAGQLDVWVSQVGTGKFDNLTLDLDPLLTPGNLLRSLGFSGNGSEIWFNPIGNPGLEKVLMPLTGGIRRAFLGAGYVRSILVPRQRRPRLLWLFGGRAIRCIWPTARAGTRVLFTWLTKAREVFFRKGVHTHNPVWSPDGAWIYFVHGREAAGEMDVWRMRPPANHRSGLRTRTHR